MSWEGEKGTQDKETLKKTEDTAIVAKKNFKAIKYDLKKGKCHTQENLEIIVIPKP